MLAAARKDDIFVCPNHGGGSIQGPCCPGVLINNRPAARVGDGGPCGSSGTTDTIKRGNPLVLIGGAPAAGMAHPMAGGGMVATGCADVFIGNPVTDENGNLIPTPPECKFVLDLLDPPPNNLARFRSPAQVTPGPSTLYPFPGTFLPQPAVTTMVTIRGHTVVVVAPAPGVPVNGQLPTAAQVASSLGALSDEQLRRLHTVVLNPVGSPNNAHWQKLRHDPNHQSAAESGSGRTTIYPTRAAPSGDRLDRVMQHETGHFIWQDLPSADREAWQEAMDSDRRAISDYGNREIREDFCEAVLMYSLVKGTPCEAAMKAAFPKRFAMLEEIFSHRGFRAP